MNEIATKDKLVSDVREVITDAERLLRETAHDLSGKAKEAHQKLSLQLDTAKERLKDWEGVVKEKAIEGAKETDRVIREHPYESIGVAFGVGILIGILLNRK
ncbi:MAG: DUF883 domain-containing protein [Candidatus Methylacidiphilales bacterium]|nr:DUF883 domain-containing protein [Candidatus Methylacidiphilales bacterium]